MPWTKEKLDKKRMFNKELKKKMEKKQITYDQRMGMARVFNADLDEFGFCEPDEVTKVRVDIKNRKVVVIK